MKEPFLYKETVPVDWPLGQVVQMVEDLKSVGCLEALVAEADRAGRTISVPADTLNFVKSFLFHNGHHKSSEKAADMIRSASCGRPPGGGPPVFPPPGPGDPPPHM